MHYPKSHDDSIDPRDNPMTHRRSGPGIPMYGALPINKRPVNRTLLHFWLKQHGIGRDRFARCIGCNPRMVDYWCDGRALPGLPYAFMIEKVTAGAVGAGTWLGTEVGRYLWNEIQKKAKTDGKVTATTSNASGA